MKKTVRAFLLLFAAAAMLAVLPACTSGGDPATVAGTYFMTSASGRVDGIAVSEENYEYYRVILREDGTCTVRAKGAGGGEAYEASGKFSYAEGKVKMTTKSGAGTSKETYLYEDGVLTLRTETKQANSTMLFTRMDDIVGSYELSDQQVMRERVRFAVDYFESYRIAIDLEGNAVEEYERALGTDRTLQQTGTYFYKDGTVRLDFGGGKREEYTIRDGAIKLNLEEDGLSVGLTLSKEVKESIAGVYGMFDISGTTTAEIDGVEQEIGITKAMFAERFDGYCLTLGADGAARFEIRPAEGESVVTAGSYTYRDGTIDFTAADGSHRSCTYADGVITVEEEWEGITATLKLAAVTGRYEIITLEGTVDSGSMHLPADRVITFFSIEVGDNGFMTLTMGVSGEDQVSASGEYLYRAGNLIPVEDGTEAGEAEYIECRAGFAVYRMYGDGVDVTITLGRLANS